MDEDLDEGRMTEHRRMVEAILFASDRPLSLDEISERLPEGASVETHVAALIRAYQHSGVNLVKVADKFMFRTAEDLAFLLRREVEEPRKLSRAAVETLAIIAYHQPVTRAEVEDIRGVSISKGTLDVLMEAGWVRVAGRKRTPGRPVTFGTTEDFLVHFGIDSLKDLPGIAELKAAGLLDTVEHAFHKMADAAGVPSREDDRQIDLEDAIAASERKAGEAFRRAAGLEEEIDYESEPLT